jgi:hypothetical protein
VGEKTVKRYSFGMLAAVAITGLSLVATGPMAYAKGPSTTINSVVGHSVIRGLGVGATFAAASCTSADAAVAPCAIWNNQPPKDSVRVWCLGPTATAGVTETVAYVADSPRVAIPPTTLTVHCKAARVPQVPTPGYKVGTPLSANAPAFTVRSCTTDILGTACTYAGETITKACTLTASVNTLPVMVTASVTLNGPPAIDGKTINVSFECR